MPDQFSHGVAGVVRMFWDLVATYANITGIGLILAFIAMGYGGIVPWLLALPCIALGIFLAWISYPLRKRYLRWVRSSVDGS